MADLPLTARHARRTVVAWQVLFGGFALAGLALVATGLAIPLLRTGFLLQGGLLAAVFLALLLMARRRLNDPRPVITITAGAFHDRRLGDPVPWSAIRRLRRHQPGRRLFLLIDTDEPDRWLTRAGLLGVPMQKLNPQLGFPAVVARLDGLDVAQDDLALAAEAAWRSSRAAP